MLGLRPRTEVRIVVRRRRRRRRRTPSWNQKWRFLTSRKILPNSNFGIQFTAACSLGRDLSKNAITSGGGGMDDGEKEPESGPLLRRQYSTRSALRLSREEGRRPLLRSLDTWIPLQRPYIN